MSKPNLAFLPHLQGIRALAVILVLIFHYNSDTLPGGFIGVDIFFVVSGFIITRLILFEIENTGRLDLIRFWARRIRRLLPIATLVLLVTLWLSYYFIDETRIVAISSQILYCAIYIVNWIFANQSIDYAMQRADPSPVLHYWSLSIEEQFYIFWPICLALIAFIPYSRRNQKLRIRLITIFFILITIASFSWSVFSSLGNDFKASYFVTTTRVWQLSIGGLVAVAKNKKNSLNLNYGLIASWIGFLGLIFCSIWLSLNFRYPGWIAILPVIGTVLLIISEKGGEWSLVPIFEWKPIQYIGDLSYSIYLWHWPVYIFLPFIENHYSLKFDLTERWLPYIIITVLLSIISKHCIEDPFRHGYLSRLLKQKRAYGFGLFLILMTVSISLKVKSDTETKIDYAKAVFLNSIDSNYPGAAVYDQNYTIKLNTEVQIQPDPLIAKHDRPDLYDDGCDLKQTFEAVGCKYGSNESNIRIFLVGDSHAAQYAPALQKLSAENQWQLTVFEKAACPLADIDIRFSETGEIKSDCQSWKKQVIDIIIEERPSLVIVSGGLPNLYRGYYWLPTDMEIVAGYVSIWQAFQLKSIPILAIRDNPRPKQDIPSCVAQYRTNVELCSMQRSVVLDSNFDPLINAAKLTNTPLLDLTNYFCKDEICPAVIGNLLVYRDGDHLTASYSKSLSPYIEPAILSLLNSKSKQYK